MLTKVPWSMEKQGQQRGLWKVTILQSGQGLIRSITPLFAERKNEAYVGKRLA